MVFSKTYVKLCANRRRVSRTVFGSDGLKPLGELVQATTQPTLKPLHLTLVRPDCDGLKPLRELVQATNSPKTQHPKEKPDLTKVRSGQQKSPALAGLK